MRKIATFESEAQLCAAFIDWTKRFGLVAYPETCGWDILLVAPDCTQIGVQAKMSFNMKVLAQAVPDGWPGSPDTGPDFRAIRLPERSGAHSLIKALGLFEFAPDNHSANHFSPCLDGRNAWSEEGFYWNPSKRHSLPAYVPDVTAGASAPTQLTKWKIKALRIMALLELRGFVTREDFSNNQIDHRPCVGPRGWLLPDGFGCWKRGPELRFDCQHPMVYQQVKLEVATQLRERPHLLDRPTRAQAELL